MLIKNPLSCILIYPVMQNLRVHFFILFFMILFSSLLQGLPHFSDKGEPEILAREIVDAMTLEEKLGQILMFSWTGVNPTSEINNWITGSNLGGIKVFGWNGYDIESLSKTIGEYQDLALSNRFGIPLLVATDQEGGIVRHIIDRTALTPGNMSIGAGRLPLDAYNSGLLIGKELAAIGVNMNFAPDVDLYLKPHTAVIGTRSFSASAEDTAFLSTLWFKGHSQAGIISTVKHFPGHGRADEDSHGVLPIIDVSLEDLKKEDLLPYRMLINEGIPAVMVGHLAYSRITGDTLPSSRSSFFLNDLLKKEMGFKGMIITDDMVMYGAIMGNMTIEKACEESLKAGVDMLLVSRGPETHQNLWDRLLQSALADRAFSQRISDAAYLVLLTKLRWLKGENHVPYKPDPSTVYDHVSTPEMAQHTLNLAARSITLLKDKDHKLPMKDYKSVLLVSQDRYIKEALRKRVPGAHFFDIPSDPEAGELSARLASLKNIINRYDRVIITLRNGYDQFIVEGLEEWNDRIILVITSNPSYFEAVPWIDTVVLTYIYNFDTTDAALGVIFGDYQAMGIMPATLKGVD
jgi:beta-N-acetylhexosaminidase